MTAQPGAHARFRRAIERRALWMAEDAARELPNLALEDALQLVHLYAERGSPKYERAARRWLVRYLTEGTPSMRDAARVTVSLAKHAVDVDRRPVPRVAREDGRRPESLDDEVDGERRGRI